MAKQVRLTLQKAIAKANLRRAEAGEKPITMNSLAVQCDVAATTITRLARPVDDPKAASALSLDLASKIVTVLDCGIEDLLEVVENWTAIAWSAIPEPLAINPLFWVLGAKQLPASETAFAAGVCGIHGDYPFRLKKLRRHSCPIVAQGK